MRIKKRKRLPVEPAIEQPRILLPMRQSGVWDLERDGITQGLLAKFLTCPESARLAMVEGLTENRSSGASAYGSLFHDALDGIYGTKIKDLATLVKQCEKILTDKEAKDRKAINDKTAPDLLQEMEMNYGAASAVLPGYLAKWHDDFKDVKWLALEKPLAVKKAIDGKLYTIRGKPDGIFRTVSDGRLWLFETKTKGRVQEDVQMDKLVFDLQTMLYLWMMWIEYGEVPGGVIYNIVRNPLSAGMKQKKDESLAQFIKRIKKDTETRPEHYYIRFQSSITKQDLEAWEKEFESMLRALIAWANGGPTYRNSSACSMGGMTCKFLPVCSRNDRSRFITREVPYPELAEVGE